MILPVVGIIAVSQALAPYMALDLPSFRSLKVTKTTRYPREVTDRYYDSLRLGDPQELPERLVIKGKTHKGSNFTLGVNLEEHEIAYATWDTLTPDGNLGSGAIGIAIFGLPGLLATLPIWGTANMFYKGLELATGLDHHFLTLFLKLQPQLEKQDAEALRLALKSHLRKHRQMLTEGS